MPRDRRWVGTENGWRQEMVGGLEGDGGGQEAMTVPDVNVWWRQEVMGGTLGGGCRRQVMGGRDGQSRAPAGLHPPEQLNSLFWTSATLRPRRPAGPEHWVKSPMVGRCLSHCESQARWQSQNRWLECRRLQGDRDAHNPRGAPRPRPTSGNPSTQEGPNPTSHLPRLHFARLMSIHLPELIQTN